MTKFAFEIPKMVICARHLQSLGFPSVSIAKSIPLSTYDNHLLDKIFQLPVVTRLFSTQHHNEDNLPLKEIAAVAPMAPKKGVYGGLSGSVAIVVVEDLYHKIN